MQMQEQMLMQMQMLMLRCDTTTWRRRHQALLGNQISHQTTIVFPPLCIEGTLALEQAVHSNRVQAINHHSGSFSCSVKLTGIGPNHAIIITAGAHEELRSLLGC